MSNQPPATTHRSLTGFVTKLVGDGATYGFINDEIFFPQTNVAGGPASVGDQVFAECEYSAHLPIKWNATSVKILNKASSQHQPMANSRGDHQQQHQQQQQQQPDLLNQQQFNQGNQVAVTYQQHRQLRQQRQIGDIKQPDSNVKQQHQNTDLTTKLLEHTNNPGGEYFGSNQAQMFPQQMDGNIQPFQDQPMGPPNFTYTSQLGSAFVQNQFVPSPFMAQQPPPLLPQQPQQQQQQQPPQPPQHIMSNNQPTHNQNNQRHNNKNMGGGRFNNQGEKNERQNNRRNQNRNESKFDRPRSNDRDGNVRNSRGQQKSRDSSERSVGRNNKRDDIVARPSPPANSSARSTASIGSDRGAKSRRHYEPHNIPKTRIMTNMNAYNMKQRCPSSVHVPSDLKDIIVNQFFRLDIKNMPKPIKYTIESVKECTDTQATTGTKSETVDLEPPKEGSEVKDGETNEEVIATPQVEATTQESTSKECSTTVKEEEKQDVKIQENPTPPSSKSDIRLNHKYGVKVVLLSVPELETIYHNTFGPNLDSFHQDTKSSHSRFDNSIALLCNKGQNNGHSLIGGKFDPVIDGFVEGKINEFERHGRQPDLIATCKRIVIEQTGLDLSECRGWTLLSTFIYNNKSDYFSSKASVEYSFIYMPQIWTMLSDKFDEKLIKQDSSDVKCGDASQIEDPHMVESSETKSTGEQNLEATPAQDVENSNVEAFDIPTANEAAATISLDNLADLKVNDLKAELDKRQVKYKTGAKKADLIALLHEHLHPNQAPSTIDEPMKDEENIVNDTEERPEQQLEEGEVEADPSDDSPDPECDAITETNGKRKASDSEVGDSDNKKVCTGPPSKENRVEMIQDTFKVRARDSQQQLSLVTLHQAAQAPRHDQFELSVASNILKESFIQHLSEYMLTTLVEDNKQKASSATTSTLDTQTNSSSQETNSDTNNNSFKSAIKNPTSSEPKVSLKEYPVDRYINLAFSYFDSTHMGYVYFEDLNKLFNNTGLTISKRALISLIGDGEKFNYRTLPELSPKLSPNLIYEYPEQFSHLPGTRSSSQTGEHKNLITTDSMVEYKGVLYEVAKLVQQVQEAETMRVSLVDRFNYAIENSDRQAEEIHVLEVSQKSLAKAIKAQNDEICDLKRERDSIKKKYEAVRKSIKGTITSLSDLIKDDKQ